MSKQKRTKPLISGRIYMARTIFILLVVALCFGVVGGINYFLPQRSMKTYTSDFMKIQFDYPMNYLLEDNLNTVSLKTDKMDEPNSSITISSAGTNYANTKDHVEKLIGRNKTRVVSKQETKMPYEGIIVVRDAPLGQGKSYFFVNNFAVYHFATDDPSLFADLDAIAKSFRILE